MFKGLFKFLEGTAFWFIFVCVATLFYSVINATVFGNISTSIVVIALNLIAILWCLFAGVLPIIYLAFMKVKSVFMHE